MAGSLEYHNNGNSQIIVEGLHGDIIRRFSKAPAKPEAIVYEFTNDRALLHQYYHLREGMYRTKYEGDIFGGVEDAHDKISHVLIARRGKLCVGGCRLTVREQDETFLLPMESVRFTLRETFAKLPLYHKRHAEISGIAVMEDHFEQEILHGLCAVMYDKAVASGIDYVFTKSSYPLAKNWCDMANDFGIKTTKLSAVALPESYLQPDIAWYITASDLTGSYHSENAFSAARMLRSGFALVD